jgi:1,6-anhydro-N-acetylmuramate kinase
MWFNKYLTDNSIVYAENLDEMLIYTETLLNNKELYDEVVKNTLEIVSSEKFGVDPQLVEGLAFAWLAWAHKEKRPANLPAVTGAKGPRILGACYPA